MLTGFTVVVLCQLAGELIQSLTGLPIPGPVIGTLLLLAALVFIGHLPESLHRAANGILDYLPMLFVPAGVGVMAHFELIKAEWPAIVAAIVVSSILTIAVTGLTMTIIERIYEVVRHDTATTTQQIAQSEGNE